MSKKKYKSVRLFKNNFLEWGSHIHPATPMIVWGPVVAYFLYLSIGVHHLPFLGILACGISGVLLWTFIEYMAHRFAFHYDSKSHFGKRLVYMIHGLHHVDPNDPTRLVMPLAPAFVYACVLFPLFRLALGELWVNPFFAFFIIGYLAYDYIHYYTHHFMPKKGIGAFLKQYHMTHHYVSDKARWGISSPLWDLLLGSYDLNKESVKSGGRGVYEEQEPLGF